MKHFLDIHTTGKADLRSIIDQALAMKTARNNRPKGMTDDEQPLAGRMVALIFEKPSTRTRDSTRAVSAMVSPWPSCISDPDRKRRCWKWRNTPLFPSSTA